MYKGKRVIAITGGYNEEGKIGKVINKIPFYVDEIVAIDDGSADATYDFVQKEAVKDEEPVVVIAEPEPAAESAEAKEAAEEDK